MHKMQGIHRTPNYMAGIRNTWNVGLQANRASDPLPLYQAGVRPDEANFMKKQPIGRDISAFNEHMVWYQPFFVRPMTDSVDGDDSNKALLTDNSEINLKRFRQ